MSYILVHFMRHFCQPIWLSISFKTTFDLIRSNLFCTLLHPSSNKWEKTLNIRFQWKMVYKVKYGKLELFGGSLPLSTQKFIKNRNECIDLTSAMNKPMMMRARFANVYTWMCERTKPLKFYLNSSWFMGAGTVNQMRTLQ